MKRAFDVVVASGMLLLTLPILLAAVVAIWLESRGPVISRHVRVGRDGVCFEMLMLGSTVANTSEEEACVSRTFSLRQVDAAPNVSRVGRFLHRTSIDVLPQLWNVLLGDMSLVGPRPVHPSEGVEGPPDLVPNRSSVLPGITGIWHDSDSSEAC